jgi:monoamine oxidase
MTRIAATEIKWREGSVIVNTSSNATYVAQKAVVTVPLSVLKTSAGQEGAIGFDPPLPGDKLSALEKLDMGKVVRVVLRFRRRFWDDIKPTGGRGRTLSNMSFLLTDDEWFPTWWTTMPHREPQITGWAPFHCAERLSDRGSSFVTRRALESLSRILEVSQSELEILLEGSFFHDWQSDPFSRGAYSYGKVGADGAQQELAKNLAETLYFAGEATASPGSNGTVHGAIASGERVCIEILG